MSDCFKIWYRDQVSEVRYINLSIRERPLDFQGGPGFFSLARILFSVTFRAKIFFFNLSWARIFFSQAILDQNIFFYTIQIWKQLFSWAANRLQNYYIEVVCCLSVCVSDRDDFKWNKIANSKYIAIQLYMRVYTLMLVAIEIWHSEHSRTTVFAAKQHSVYPKSCQWLNKHTNCIRVNTFCIPKFFEVQYLHE